MRLNSPTDGPHFAYPRIHRWTLTLLPPPGHSEWWRWAVVDTQSCLHRCHHSQCFLPAPSPGDPPSTGLSDDISTQAPSSQAPSSQQWKQCWRRAFPLHSSGEVAVPEQVPGHFSESRWWGPESPLAVQVQMTHGQPARWMAQRSHCLSCQEYLGTCLSRWFFSVAIIRFYAMQTSDNCIACHKLFVCMCMCVCMCVCDWYRSGPKSTG